MTLVPLAPHLFAPCCRRFNRPGPRLVDALEFLVGLLHGAPERIPHVGNPFPWRLLQRDELREQEAAWLAEHPDWNSRVQKGPPEGAGTGGACCAAPAGVCVGAGGGGEQAEAPAAGQQQ